MSFTIEDGVGGRKKEHLLPLTEKTLTYGNSARKEIRIKEEQKFQGEHNPSFSAAGLNLQLD